MDPSTGYINRPIRYKCTTLFNQSVCNGLSLSTPCVYPSGANGSFDTTNKTCFRREKSELRWDVVLGACHVFVALLLPHLPIFSSFFSFFFSSVYCSLSVVLSYYRRINSPPPSSSVSRTSSLPVRRIDNASASPQRFRMRNGCRLRDPDVTRPCTIGVSVQPPRQAATAAEAGGVSYHSQCLPYDNRITPPPNKRLQTMSTPDRTTLVQKNTKIHAFFCLARKRVTTVYVKIRISEFRTP